MAIDRAFKNSAGEKVTDFFEVTVWRQQAEACAKCLRKGSRICVHGKLQTRTYEKDGVKHVRYEIIADEVQFLSARIEQDTSGFQVVDEPDLPF